MQQFDKLLIFTVSWLIYAASSAFPSAKASQQEPPTSGITLSRSTGNHLFVAVRVNNRPAWFAVDTGAALSIVDSNKAKLLGLSIIKVAKKGRYNAVPMRITHSGALEVEGRIGHNRYSFVVDTGGFATLVPSQVARQNGIPVIGTTVNAKGIHSKERPVGVTIAPEFDLGKYSLGPALVGVTGLPEGPDDLRYQFGGLIGADFFFERSGIIDVGSKTLYFK